MAAYSSSADQLVQRRGAQSDGSRWGMQSALMFQEEVTDCHVAHVAVERT